MDQLSAEDWGSPLRRTIGVRPISEDWVPHLCASAHRNYRHPGEDRPLRWKAVNVERLELGRSPPSGLEEFIKGQAE
jgi:hypothetical protein